MREQRLKINHGARTLRRLHLAWKAKPLTLDKKRWTIPKGHSISQEQSTVLRTRKRLQVASAAVGCSGLWTVVSIL